MNIRKAAKLAHKLGTGIYRGELGSDVIFVPTNTCGHCLIVTSIESLAPGQNWLPSLDDLVSKDWKVAIPCTKGAPTSRSK